MAAQNTKATMTILGRVLLRREDVDTDSKGRFIGRVANSERPDVDLSVTPVGLSSHQPVARHPRHSATRRRPSWLMAATPAWLTSTKLASRKDPTFRPTTSRTEPTAAANSAW